MRVLTCGGSLWVLMVATSCGGSTTSPSMTTANAARFSLTGQVVESTSVMVVTIAGATVTILDGPNAGRSATTDGSGHYGLTGLQLSSFTVNVSANDYAPQSMSVTLGASQMLSFRLNRVTTTVRPRPFELTGAVTDDDGQPVANANLTVEFLVSDVPGTHFSHVLGVTDRAGFYRIDFTAVPGALHGPTGTNDAIALLYVSQ
jgi:hypothetical protein